MLKVTDIAKQELHKALIDHDDDSDVCLRLQASQPGKLGLVLDREVEGDQLVEHMESKVLLIAPELATALEGITLDVQDSNEGASFILRTEQQME